MATDIYYNQNGEITSVSDPSATLSSGSSFNAHGNTSVTAGGGYQELINIPITHTQTIRIDGLLGWGDVAGDFIITWDDGVNPENTVGGLRTTEAKKTDQALFESRPITLAGNLEAVPDTGITIRVRAEHYSTTSHVLKANLFGTINENA